MLTAAGSALVAGSTAQPRNVRVITVKVLRAFLWKGDPVKVGVVVDLPEDVAAEVLGSGKAERYVAPVIETLQSAEERLEAAAAAHLEAAEKLPRRRGRPPKRVEE